MGLINSFVVSSFEIFLFYNFIYTNMWKEEDNKLSKEFVCKDFVNAFMFMTQVATVINDMDHHPEWSNIYNKVNISLSTHDAGDTVTDRDRQMAKRIDEIFNTQQF